MASPLVTIEVHIPSAVWSLPDIGKRIIENWHKHARELGQPLGSIIASRTPVLTGALQSSVTPEFPGAGDTLIHIFFDATPQLDAWERIYDTYQEGPVLGLSTYTNPPRRMLQQTDPDNLPMIKSWAALYAQEAVDVFTNASVTVP